MKKTHPKSITLAKITRARPVTVVVITDCDSEGFYMFHMLKHGAMRSAYSYLNSVFAIPNAIRFGAHVFNLGFTSFGMSPINKATEKMLVSRIFPKTKVVANVFDHQKEYMENALTSLVYGSTASAAELNVKITMDIYEALVATFGHERLRRILISNEDIEFKSELEDFWISYYNWAVPFNVYRMISFGVPGICVNRFVHILNVKYGNHIRMNNPKLNSILNTNLRYSEDESLQIMQIDIVDYLLIHKTRDEIVVYSTTLPKNYITSELNDLLKIRYLNHGTKLILYHHIDSMTKTRLGSIVCCL